MSFLDKIAALNRARVAAAQKILPVAALQEKALYHRQPAPVLPAFQASGTHIIAEVKFASPSQGLLRDGSDAVAVAVAGGYLKAGAHMLSVLTEPEYFKGSLGYLAAIRAANPDALLLRKDFILDEYQLHEARAAGADAALLIVAMTGFDHTRDLLQAAKSLHLAPLVEVHDAGELELAVKMGADFIGVNNRNLKTLAIDLETGRKLAQQKPAGSVFICESGLSTPADVITMRNAGYDGFLMGTHFMRQDNPGAALAQLLEEAK